ncbi:alanine aminotransferase 1-like [Dromaius novaehollandiae]|uniref:alanine aminotransferase 1-like n=1 Tax=Dromaius novaehollandiae TaxID=8790 RepID=UPI00311E61E7
MQKGDRCHGDTEGIHRYGVEAVATTTGHVAPREGAAPASGPRRPPPLQPLLQRAAALQRELEQGKDKPFTEVVWCHSGDPAAAGRRPLALLRQVAAACVCPELLGTVSAEAGQLARRVLQHLHGGSPGAYNLEYVTGAVADAAARFLQRRDGGIACAPGSVVPCGGTAAAVLDVVSLVADAGAARRAAVLLPAPGPPLHAAAAALAGTAAVPYRLAEERGWDVDVAEVRRALRQARARCDPKVLCVVNPGDPTGHVLSRQSMEDIIRLVHEENLLLLADEVHQDSVATPGRPFLSFKRVLCEMGAPLATTVQLVSFYSLSKSIAGESGFRAGFFELVNIDPGILKCFYTWGLSVYPPILGQVLLHMLLEPPGPDEPCYAAFAAEEQAVRSDLALKARLVQDLLAGAPGISCQPVQGGVRAFPRIQLPPRAVREAQEQGLEPDFFFCQKLLEATGIVLAPGSAFGQQEGTYHVGLSLLLPAETLRRVLGTVAEYHAAFVRDFS